MSIKRKFRKRRPGNCEICGFSGCPVCSEDELFRQMGISGYECMEDPHVWIAMQDQITGLQADFIAFRMKPEAVARDFAKRINKVALVFEEICKRRFSD